MPLDKMFSFESDWKIQFENKLYLKFLAIHPRHNPQNPHNPSTEMFSALTKLGAIRKNTKLKSGQGFAVNFYCSYYQIWPFLVPPMDTFALFLKIRWGWSGSTCWGSNKLERSSHSNYNVRSLAQPGRFCKS